MSSAYANTIGIWDIIIQDTPQQQAQQEQALVHTAGYMLLLLHSNIANRALENDAVKNDALLSIQKLEELTKTDIIHTIDIASDKEDALVQYLTACDQEIQRGDIIATYIKQEMLMYKENMESCMRDKDISDQTYFDAVALYDQHIMDNAITSSIGYEKCVAENRIQYNAKITIIKKIVFYLGLLQKKYEILSNKQEILAKNYDIFRDKILPELNELDEFLNQYRF